MSTLTLGIRDPQYKGGPFAVRMTTDDGAAILDLSKTRHEAELFLKLAETKREELLACWDAADDDKWTVFIDGLAAEVEGMLTQRDQKDYDQSLARGNEQ